MQPKAILATFQYLVFGLLVGVILSLMPFYAGLPILCVVLFISFGVVIIIRSEIRNQVWPIRGIVFFVSLTGCLLASNYICEQARFLPPLRFEEVTLMQFSEQINKRLDVSGSRIVFADKNMATNTISLGWNKPMHISEVIDMLDEELLTRLSLFGGKSTEFALFSFKGLPHIYFLVLQFGVVVGQVG